MSRTCLFLILILISTTSSYGQKNLFVNQLLGSDTNTGLSATNAFQSFEKAITNVVAGDTIKIMGTYQNSSYNGNFTYQNDVSDAQFWKDGENTIKLNNINGSENAYITITAYDDSTKILGDANSILRVTNSSYLRFVNLQIEGEVERIPYNTAKALQFVYKDSNGNIKYRVANGTSDVDIANLILPVLDDILRPTYTDTVGLYLSNVHHIEIINNHIHHLPGGGLRVSDGEYILIQGNEINDCSRKSYSGTHALVVTNSISTDLYDGYKIQIIQNSIHHNYNEIYSWSPQKTYITPRIDEGKGISLQRNRTSDNWTHGRILIANNICYWNGYSGIHNNSGSRIDIIHNTCFNNSYTNTITYANNPSGNNIGISSQGGDGVNQSDDVNIINNIVVVNASWSGFPISINDTSNLTIEHNLLYDLDTFLSEDVDVTAIATNTVYENPLFTNSDLFDFSLTSNSPALNTGITNNEVLVDYFNHTRDTTPDLGAIETILPDEDTPSPDTYTQTYATYPNPFTNQIALNNGTITNEKIRIYNLMGKDFTKYLEVSTTINTEKLPVGTYILSIDNHHKIVMKIND